MADPFAAVWAKSPRAGEPAGEGLTAHTANVLRRLADLRRRAPALEWLSGEPRLWHRAAWACALHDLGKQARGFQTMLRGGERFAHRHEVLSLGFLPWALGTDPGGDLPWVAAGVASHHKDRDRIETSYPHEDEAAARSLAAELPDDAGERVARFLTEHLPATLARLGLGDLGLSAVGVPDPVPGGDALRRVVARNVASALRAYGGLARELEEGRELPRRLAGLFTRGLVTLADHAGSAHERLGAFERLARPDEVRALLLGERAPWPHQDEASAVGGHALLIAPTGSGKTEAALLWAARQASARGRAPCAVLGAIPGDAHAAPETRCASAPDDSLRGGPGRPGPPAPTSELPSSEPAPAGEEAPPSLPWGAAESGERESRSDETEGSPRGAAARPVGPGERPPVLYYVLPYQASLNAMRRRFEEGVARGLADAVTLQHSRAVQALYRQLLDKGYGREAAERAARRERDLGRLHASGVRITTPYQLLRGAFALPGHEAITTDLAGGLLVVDEVHAYEPARLGQLLALLGWAARALDARVLVMSATLPDALARLVTETLGGEGAVSRLEASAATFARFRRHRLQVRPGELLAPEVLDEVAARARAGEAVLCVLTTVRRAQEAWRGLRERLPSSPVRLLHARLTGRDRLAREQELAEAVGTARRAGAGLSGPGGPGPVLVATQVVEVSLDVDFDALYSDPAPLEALVQRFGRVNRGRRHAERPVVVFDAPDDGCRVYEPDWLAAALDVLRPAAGALVDEAEVGRWLGQVYAGPRGERWARTVAAARDAFQREVLERPPAFRADARLAAQFDEQFDGTEVLPAQLEVAYGELALDAPLEAAALLVPISWGQRMRLEREGRLRAFDAGTRARGRPRRGAPDAPEVATVPYDDDLGLVLTGGAARA